MSKKITATFIRELLRENGLWPKSVIAQGEKYRVSLNHRSSRNRLFEILRSNRIWIEVIPSYGDSEVVWFKIMPDAVLSEQAGMAWMVIGFLCHQLSLLMDKGLTQEDAINRAYPAVDYDDDAIGIGVAPDVWFIHRNPNIQYSQPIGPEANPVVSLEEAAGYLYGQRRQAQYQVFTNFNGSVIRVLALEKNRALVTYGIGYMVVAFPETQTFLIEYREEPFSELYPGVSYELRWDGWGSAELKAEVYPDPERGSSVRVGLTVGHYGDLQPRTDIGWYSTSGNLETGRRFLAAYQQAVTILEKFEAMGPALSAMVQKESDKAR